MSTTTSYAGAATNVSYGLPVDDSWGTPADATGAVGGGSPSGSNTYYQQDGNSKWLYLSSFTFSIPAGATIAGIKVSIWHRTTLTAGYGTNGADIDIHVAVTKDGSTFLGDTVVLNQRPTSTPYESSSGNPVKVFTQVDSSSGLWGTTWTKAELDASTFGVGVRTVVNLDDTFNNFEVEIDGVQVTVTYNLRRAADADEVIFGV